MLTMSLTMCQLVYNNMGLAPYMCVCVSEYVFFCFFYLMMVYYVTRISESLDRYILAVT